MTSKPRTAITLIAIGSARRLTRASDDGLVLEPGSTLERWM